MSCQSYEEALEMACQSPVRAPAVQQHSLVAAETIWITQNVSNKRALQFYADLGKVPAVQRGEMLRREASRAGLNACPLADKMDEWSADVGALERR
jgi:hypothetical protein